ncbi:MAG: integrase, partial [Thermoplasmatota archaeon]
MQATNLKNKDLLEYREIERWLTGSPYSTKANYLSSLKKYLIYRDMNPEKLIDEIEADRKKSKREQGEVELEAKKFLEWLRTDREKETGGYNPRKTGEKGMSDKAVASILGAIRSFYRANGFTL